ncbi:MAG: response regulator [Gammaproteobacteria bacterium]|nr:MAG: response regulator [Gammaproteobacteria bacterium]
MSTQVLICDDSSFARKQLARSLPAEWDIKLNFAVDGADAISNLEKGKADVLFLDLNMPNMDGYEVLEKIRKQQFDTLVIVVSGDIQPEAYKRVMGLGAMAFIKKPGDAGDISKILETFGLCSATSTDTKISNLVVNINDAYQEIANIAMGQAVDLLAQLLDCFVKMPVPNVNKIEASELRMTLKQIQADAELSAVCQGFIGSGIAGEALLIFNDSSYADIAKLLKYDETLDDAFQIELLMDISNIMIGACLKGIADQLDISFSQGNPVVLGRHLTIRDLLKRDSMRWKKVLTIEMGCSIEGYNVNTDLLLLFTEDSIKPLDSILKYISN